MKSHFIKFNIKIIENLIFKEAEYNKNFKEAISAFLGKSQSNNKYVMG